MDPWWIAAPTVAAGLAGLAAYGAVRPSSQLFGSSLYATDAPRKFALTFDDGPNPSITPKLLDLLDRHNVKAYVFRCRQFRSPVSRSRERNLRSRPCHRQPYRHSSQPLFLRTRRRRSVELQRCSEAILKATWESPRLFRPPFGFRSPWLGEIAHQFRYAHWLPGRSSPAIGGANLRNGLSPACNPLLPTPSA